MSTKILIVDDDSMLRSALREQLEEKGYWVQEAGDVARAMQKLDDNSFDAILLDVGLPDMDGREACRAMRQANIIIPIIMLTAHDSEEDVINGFSSGASDYIAKPFRLGELFARLQSHLDQHEKREDASYMIGNYRFHPHQRFLRTSDEENKIPLTDKEASILKMLYRANGDIIKREDLLQKVWGYSDKIVTHTLETHMYRLRHKLESYSNGRQYLITVPGMGYYLDRKGIKSSVLKE